MVGRFQLTPEQLELGFLATHCKVSELRLAREAGVDTDSFQVEEHARAWEYLVDRYGAGTNPTVADLRAVFGLELAGDLEDSETWRNELVAVSTVRRVQRVLIDDMPTLRTAPKKTLEKLLADLGDVHRSDLGARAFFDENAGDRLAAYQQMFAPDSPLSQQKRIPTGLSYFDDEGDYFKRGDLIAVQGATNIGKSWLLCNFAAVAWLTGHKVLFLSPESSTDDIQWRLDTIIGRRLGFNLRNTELRQGKVDLDEYGRYLDRVEEMKRADLQIVDSGDSGAFTVSDVGALSREYRPDMLVIDGFHLIDVAGKQTWEDIREAAKKILGFGKRLDMVVVANTQVQRDAVMAQDDAAELGQSAYGMGLMEAAHRVISMAAKRGDPHQRVWKLVKHRDAEKDTRRKYLRFNVDVGDIGDFNPLPDEETGLVSFD